eukprot:9345552-Karenia_brevis.AAC.1
MIATHRVVRERSDTRNVQRLVRQEKERNMAGTMYLQPTPGDVNLSFWVLPCPLNTMSSRRKNTRRKY